MLLHLKDLDLLEELKLKGFLSQGYLDLGELYSDMKRKDESLKYLKKAEGMFKEMGMDYFLNKTQKLLERIQ